MGFPQAALNDTSSSSLSEIDKTQHLLPPDDDSVRLKVPALGDTKAAHVERTGLNQLVQGSPPRTSKQDALINIIDRNPRAEAARSPHTFVPLILQHFDKFYVNGRQEVSAAHQMWEVEVSNE